MAKITADRVFEISLTTGTGPYTLLSAVTGYQRFSSVCASGDTFDYYAEQVNVSGVPTGAWETGLGTWSTGNILARTTVYASSNSNVTVNWASGGSIRIALGINASTVNSLLTADTTIAAAIAAIVVPSIESVPAISKTLHSGNVLKAFIYDTYKDSDGGAWRKRCTDKSWYTETIYGQWQGQCATENIARGDNLLNYPEQFDNATWWYLASGTVTRTANTTLAPDGTTTADTITKVGTTDAFMYQSCSVVGNTQYTSSIYVYKDGVTSRVVELYCRIGLNGSGVTERYLSFNTATGAGYLRASTGATIVTYGVIDAGTYWRVWFTSITGASDNTWFVGVRPSIGTVLGVTDVTAGGSVTLWGGKLNLGSSPTPYIANSVMMNNYYWQSTGNGKFYTPGASYGTPVEVFRGNVREFPEQVAMLIDSATGYLVIYDLTQPNTPMWMVFQGSYTPNAVSLGTNSLVDVKAINGEMIVANGASASNYSMSRTKFIQDVTWMYAISSSQGGIDTLPISMRNTAGHTYLTGSGTSPLGTVGSLAGVAVSVIVPPSAQTDPASGLPSPIIAYGANPLSIVQSNGTVVSTAIQFNAPGCFFDKDNSVYSIGENNCNIRKSYYPYTTYSNSNWPGAPFLGYSAPIGTIYNGFGSQSKGVMAVWGNISYNYLLQFVRENPSNFGAIMAAKIGNTYNSGWQVGDCRGSWLADTVAETITASGELITNGTFDPSTTGWTKTDADVTSAIVSGAANISHTTTSASRGLYQDITVVAGVSYTLQATLGGTLPQLVAFDGATFAGGSNIGQRTTSGALSFTPSTTTLRIRIAASDASSTATFDDISLKLTASTELVTNGTFTTDTSSWAAGGTGATLTWDATSGGRLLVTSGTGGNGYAVQAVTVVIGRTYTLGCTYTVGTGSLGLLGLGNSSGALNLMYRSLTPGGTYSYTFVPTGTTVYIRIGANEPTTGATYYFDNVTLKDTTELVTNGAFEGTFTGWSRNAADQTSVCVNGQLVCNSGVANNVFFNQNITTVVGKSYRFQYDVISGSGNYSLYSTAAYPGNFPFTGTVVLRNTQDFIAASTTTNLSIAAGGGYATATFDNISCKLAQPDRSARGNGLVVYGTLTKAAVASGSQLVSYSGFSYQGYALLPGISSPASYFSTPNATANQIVSDIDIRVMVQLNSYASGANQDFVTKDTGGSNFAFVTRLSGGGNLQLYWSADGSALLSATSTVTVPSTQFATIGFRWTLQCNNGTGRVVTFYTSTDFVNWVQLGYVVTGTATSIFNSTSTVSVGRGASASVFLPGRIFRAQVYNGIYNGSYGPGVLALDFDPTKYISGSTFTATTGEVYTINGGATIVGGVPAYLQQPYNTNLDFGTGAWDMGAWINTTGYGPHNLQSHSEDGTGFVAAGTTPPTVTSSVSFLGKIATKIDFDSSMTSTNYAGCRSTNSNSFTVVAGATYTTRCMVSLSRALTGSETITVYTTGIYALYSLTLTSSNSAPFVGVYLPITGNSVAILGGGDYFTVLLTTVVGSAVSLYITELQVNRGATLLPYKATTSSAYNGLAPIFDRSGILTQNLLICAELFDNAAWTKNTATVTANQAIAPDGTTTADLVYPTSSGVDRGVYQPRTVSAVTSTFSVYVKSAGFSIIALVKLSGAGYAAWFNLSTGVTSNVDGSYTANISNVGGGWYLCSITGTASATTYCQIVLADAAAGNSATTSGTKGVYLWGAQLNIGSTPLPYQPGLTTAYTNFSSIKLGIDGAGLLTGQVYDGTTTRTVSSTVAVNTGLPVLADMQYATNGTVSLILNDTVNNTATGTALLTLSNTTAVMTVGNSFDLTSPFPGSICLATVSATVPTLDQTANIYRDELKMFQPGAQCTLDGNSVANPVIAYDETSDQLHVATPWGRSSFRDLIRVSSQASTVGTISTLSANQNSLLTGGSTGAIYTQPALLIRDEVRRRDTEKKAAGKVPVFFDFDAVTSQVAFVLPKGYTTKDVYSAGVHKRLGSTKDYTINNDGYQETVTFTTAPGNNIWVSIMAVRNN